MLRKLGLTSGGVLSRDHRFWVYRYETVGSDNVSVKSHWEGQISRFSIVQVPLIIRCNREFSVAEDYALINRECGPYAKIFVVTSCRTDRSEVRAAWRHNKYFPYGPNSRLIRALLYTHTSKTTKSQCFPLLLWTEVRPVHTPVRTQAYGLALSQSNFSILSVFCLVYNNWLFHLFGRNLQNVAENTVFW